MLKTFRRHPVNSIRHADTQFSKNIFINFDLKLWTVISRRYDTDLRNEILIGKFLPRYTHSIFSVFEQAGARIAQASQTSQIFHQIDFRNFLSRLLLKGTSRACAPGCTRSPLRISGKREKEEHANLAKNGWSCLLKFAKTNGDEFLCQHLRTTKSMASHTWRVQPESCWARSQHGQKEFHWAHIACLTSTAGSCKRQNTSRHQLPGQ